MARKLPFVVQPRQKTVVEKIGVEETGIIEIERRGYVTVGEKAMVDQAMQGSSAATQLRSLVASIAEIENKEFSEVMSDLTADAAPEYLNDWTDDIVKCFNAIGIENAKRDMLQATALLISRIDAEWTIEDTMQQHQDLVKALSDFYVEENSDDLEELAQDSENSGAEGKK